VRISSLLLSYACSCLLMFACALLRGKMWCSIHHTKIPIIITLKSFWREIVLKHHTLFILRAQRARTSTFAVLCQRHEPLACCIVCWRAVIELTFRRIGYNGYCAMHPGSSGIRREFDSRFSFILLNHVWSNTAGLCLKYHNALGKALV